jgi:hypothetical protein
VREEGGKEVKLLRATVVLQEVEPLCWSRLEPSQRGPMRPKAPGMREHPLQPPRCLGHSRKRRLRGRHVTVMWVEPGDRPDLGPHGSEAQVVCMHRTTPRIMYGYCWIHTDASTWSCFVCSWSGMLQLQEGL